MLPSLLASIIALALLFPASGAPEWPRFRGPNGAGLGLAPQFPAQFSAADFNWKVDLPGRGHSSPVIAGQRLFLTCTPPDSARRVLVALDVKDGHSLWTKEWETPSFRLHADNSFTSASPAVDDERVYLWWTSPEQSWLAAVDQKDGREIWKKELGGFISQHGAGSSPIVFEDSVILDFGQEGPQGKGSYTLCVDARTGAVRWQTPRLSESSTAATPCLYTPASGGAAQLILVSRTAGITSLDPHTGQEHWSIPDLLSLRCVASPVAAPGGLIIAQCGEGNTTSQVRAVRPSPNGASAEKAYAIDRTGGYVPTPLIVRDRLYLVKENGLVSCFQLATGEPVWSERVEGPFYGSPVCLNDRLYVMTRRGDLVVLAASDAFQPLARIPLGEGSFATPSVAGGRLYLRTFTHLISVGK